MANKETTYVRLARRMIWYYTLSKSDAPQTLLDKTFQMVQDDLERIKEIDLPLLGSIMEVLYPQYQISDCAKNCPLDRNIDFKKWN